MFKGMILKTNDIVKDTVAFLIIKKKLEEGDRDQGKPIKQSDPRTTCNAHVSSIIYILYIS